MSLVFVSSSNDRCQGCAVTEKHGVLMSWPQTGTSLRLFRDLTVRFWKLARGRSTPYLSVWGSQGAWRPKSEETRALRPTSGSTGRRRGRASAVARSPPGRRVRWTWRGRRAAGAWLGWRPWVRRAASAGGGWSRPAGRAVAGRRGAAVGPSAAGSAGDSAGGGRPSEMGWVITSPESLPRYPRCLQGISGEISQLAASEINDSDASISWVLFMVIDRSGVRTTSSKAFHTKATKASHFRCQNFGERRRRPTGVIWPLDHISQRDYSAGSVNRGSTCDGQLQLPFRRCLWLEITADGVHPNWEYAQL